MIAEPGMTWDRNLDAAYRLIDAAKECGADVAKFQWCSSGRKIQERRKVDSKYIAIYEHGVQYPREWLEKLKGHCDQVGIEFACTTYLIEDIAVVAPLVKRFKVSAYESGWEEFTQGHRRFGKPLIVSKKHEGVVHIKGLDASLLYCVSEYPTPLEKLRLQRMDIADGYDGLSDHTANVLTGAAAVAAGARIVEAHIRLNKTSKDNPDYGHSLMCDVGDYPFEGSDVIDGNNSPFAKYVRNIRTVERML